MKNIDKYLEKEKSKKILRFMTCGSVDDGKSTLIGRMLYDTNSIFNDQLEKAKKDSIKYGNKNNEIDLSLLLDGLSSEKEQGITIDIAYRYFSTNKKKFIIADSPGHLEYTRNMVTAASNSELAIILINIKKGITEQTLRHIYLLYIFGIKNIIISINKMDLVNYSETKFNTIVKELSKFIKNKFETIYIVPTSAINGDNVVKKSKNMSWYNGKTIMNILNNIKIKKDKQNKKSLIFAVQYINKDMNFRGYCGKLISGNIENNQKIKIFPSGKTTKIKNIIKVSSSNLNEKKKVELNENVTLELEDEVSLSRGNFIILDKKEYKIGNSINTNIICLVEEELNIENEYIIKYLYGEYKIKINKINYLINVSKQKKEKKKINTKLKLNDIANCDIELEEKILFDTYKNNKELGSFIIIDKFNNKTVGAGFIVKGLDKNDKIIKNNKKYTQKEINLNQYIRKNYPEWECKKIDDL